MNDIAYGCDKTLTNDTKQPKSFAYKQPKNRIHRESKARVNKQAHAKIARKYTQIKGKKRIEHTLIHGDKGNEIDTKKELALRMKTPSETAHSHTHTHTLRQSLGSFNDKTRFTVFLPLNHTYANIHSHLNHTIINNCKHL